MKTKSSQLAKQAVEAEAVSSITVGVRNGLYIFLNSTTDKVFAFMNPTDEQLGQTVNDMLNQKKEENEQE